MDPDARARLVAEQVAVDCTPDEVEDVLAGQALRRLLPLVRLAGERGSPPAWSCSGSARHQ